MTKAGLSPESFNCLSPRERQILRLFSRGKCGKEIAADLGIQYYTVGTYKKRIMAKLELKNHNHFLIAAITYSFFPDGKSPIKRKTARD